MRTDTSDFLKTFADAEYLFLRHIGEPSENSVLLLVEEAAPRSGPTESRWISGVELTGLRVVESDHKSPLFELHWDTYAAYSVTNELYSARDQSAVCEGKLVQICTTSAYLSFLQKSTFATAEYPGPLLHLRLHCENHTIDVASVQLPRVTRVRK